MIDNAEDLGIVIPLISGSLGSHYRDKTDNVDNNVSDVKSFKYKTK